MKLAFVFAHYDDLLIWALGTLLKLKVNHDCDILHLVTHAEGNQTKFIQDFSSKLGIKTSLISISSVSDEITNFNPDKIFTHWSSDCNSEHREVFNLVHDSVLHNRIVNNRGELFSISTYNGVGVDSLEFTPNRIIDITEFWPEKEKYLSQIQGELGTMWLNLSRKQSEFYGSRIKASHAEAFKKVPVNGVYASGDNL